MNNNKITTITCLYDTKQNINLSELYDKLIGDDSVQISKYTNKCLIGIYNNLKNKF